jgi:hypothetical protein
MKTILLAVLVTGLAGFQACGRRSDLTPETGTATVNCHIVIAAGDTTWVKASGDTLFSTYSGTTSDTVRPPRPSNLLSICALADTVRPPRP